MILSLSHAFLTCAIGTAIERFVGFDAVSYDLTTAVIADWRQLVDSAFEAVKGVTRAGCDYFKRSVILVLTDIAPCHRSFSFTDMSLSVLESSLVTPRSDPLDLRGSTPHRPKRK